MSNTKRLSNLPPRGTADWFPEEFTIRNYIFNKWRTVCQSFGYEEYLTPIVENADIYRAKSGEDVGGSELMVMQKGDDELAIRPEMTPSVTRLVSRIYNGRAKPIRFFSIANFMRFQKPQKGRNREFWQLNLDMFGANNLLADIEILQVSLEIMMAFNPPKGAFTLFINNRKLIEAILGKIGANSPEIRVEIVRILDKSEKLSREELVARFSELGLNQEQIENLIKFIDTRSASELEANFADLKTNEGYQEILTTLKTLEELGYGEWIKFQPNVIRGFDYYDGMVFEIFDNNPENNRSLFGGGRYNGLASLFGSESFPAVGCAPGDETFKLFLEGWGLLENIQTATRKRIYLPLIDANALNSLNKVAKSLRANQIVESSVEVISISKALQYASKKAFDYVILLGENELNKGTLVLKNLQTGEQSEVEITKISEFVF